MALYKLPLLSGVLLALSFFPFYLSALAFVALAPLFYFASGDARSGRELFWGGFLVGLVGIGPLVYLSLAQLTLFQNAEAFTFLIRASSIPVALCIGVLFGALALAYARLRTHSSFFNALTGASLYLIVIELPLRWLFDGYYYGALSHAVVPFGAPLALSALGGAALVSWFVALGSVSLAEACCSYMRGSKNYFLLPLGIGLLWAGLCVTHRVEYVFAKGPSEPMSVTVIQGLFEDYVPHSADTLVIYPLSLSEGITTPAQDAAIGERLRKTMHASTTLVLWQTTEDGARYFDELAAWRDGSKTSYRKRVLYALSDDYTPRWLKDFGIEKSPYGITAGMEDENGVIVGDIPAGGLVCSELHQADLARKTAAESPLLLAVGSDAMFPGSLSGNFSLAAARLRAAENATPVIRANLLGPSAIIAPSGSVQAMLAYGERGVLRGSVAPLSGQTPYALMGDLPVHALAVAVLLLASALSLRRSTTALDRKAQG